MAEQEWIKTDLHIHTLDDPCDALDYSAHQLLERAKELGFGVLAITLHNAVFDRAEVFADAESMGILLIPAAEMRLEGADVILLNTNADEVRDLKTFEDLRRLRARRGDSLYTIVPHPFYIFGGSIGRRIVREMDCFDAIEQCHFHKGWFDPNKPAERIAKQFNKPMIATSDAHQLHAFGSHYTSIPRPAALTIGAVIDTLRSGQMRPTSPPASIGDILGALWFIYFVHPWRLRRRGPTHSGCAHS